MKSGGTETRLDALRRKLRARENVPGYEKNCEMLRAEIERLSAPPPVASKPKKGKRAKPDTVEK